MIPDVSKLPIVASFMVNDKHILFMYNSSDDRCYVVLDYTTLGYFAGDDLFRKPDNSVHSEVIFPKQQRVYSFELEFIPAYVALITQLLIKGEL